MPDIAKMAESMRPLRRANKTRGAVGGRGKAKIDDDFMSTQREKRKLIRGRLVGMTGEQRGIISIFLKPKAFGIIVIAKGFSIIASSDTKITRAAIKSIMKASNLILLTYVCTR